VCIWGFTVVHGQPAISSSDTILLNLLTWLKMDQNMAHPLSFTLH
jgi:hypothetical protein